MSRDAEHRGEDGTVLFGRLLRAWRERALLTQEQLAERSGLNVRTIRRFETDPRVGRVQSASLRQLAGALGLEPTERAVLVDAARGVPVPLGRTGGAAAGRRGPEPSLPVPVRPPRQLPAPPPQFTGRTADLARLEEVRAQPGMVVVALDGMAGIGKTALALHAAHRWSGEYPDGQLFLDLQGHTRGAAPLGPGDALHRLLRALGLPGAQIPDDPDGRAALYRSHLADRRVLVLLDDAAGEAQVRPLLPGAPGCLVLVTSRRKLVGLDLTHAHSLDLLPADDAVTLFVRSGGGGGASAQPPARLSDVVELCGRLPLAIRAAAARLRSRPSWTLAHLVDRLRSPQHRLAELEVGDRSVTAALELSYLRLAPDVRYVYRMLGLHPGVELELGAAVALTGRPPVHVRRLLDPLLDVHLLQEPVPERYRFHDLTRAHAASAVGQEETEADRRAALARLCRHYCRETGSAVVAAYPYERESRPWIAPATQGDPPRDPAEAAAWLDTELPNLLIVAEHAGSGARADCLVHLSGALHRHLRTRGRYGDAADLHERALAAARAIGDRAGELEALNDLGHIRRLQGGAGRPRNSSPTPGRWRAARATAAGS